MGDRTGKVCSTTVMPKVWPVASFDPHVGTEIFLVQCTVHVFLRGTTKN